MMAGRDNLLVRRRVFARRGIIWNVRLFQPGSNDDLAFLDAHKKRAIAAQV
jgi:class 3 adenylate cyclase